MAQQHQQNHSLRSSVCISIIGFVEFNNCVTPRDGANLVYVVADFLDNIITINKTWTLKYDTELKRQIAEWCPPNKKKIKNEQVKSENNTGC